MKAQQTNHIFFIIVARFKAKRCSLLGKSFFSRKERKAVSQNWHKLKKKEPKEQLNTKVQEKRSAPLMLLACGCLFVLCTKRDNYYLIRTGVTNVLQTDLSFPYM
jgi:hypothetical protein